MTWLAGLLVALAVALPGAPPVARPREANPVLRRRLAAAVAGTAAAVLAGGARGALLGLAVAVGADVLLTRAPSRAAVSRAQAVRRDVPLALDLLAAALSVGVDPHRALRAVASAVAGPLGHELAAVARALGLGTPPALAWAPLARPTQPAGLAAAARCAIRSADSGAPLADLLARLADAERDTARRTAEAAARRAGVLAVAPLGLCFLPAFVVLGVVPVVAGLVGTALG